MKAILKNFPENDVAGREKATKAHNRLYFYINRAHFALKETHFPKEKERFEEWFGEITDDRLKIVSKVIDTIHDKFEENNIILTKGGDSCEIGDYAYVDNPLNLFEIHLCESFFNTSDVDKIDSTLGTIIHELSHLVAGTEDYQNTYGTEACKALAKNNPNAAINNADNYEYYCESFQK